jgi:hypothetical protein
MDLFALENKNGFFMRSLKTCPWKLKPRDNLELMAVGTGHVNRRIFEVVSHITGSSRTLV